mmetsp:Transcript_36/g.31  ORF Transcript_36/g.31 Transcript_36/m.31 type:complete len:92 (-) Transcript_36:56-331(-)
MTGSKHLQCLTNMTELAFNESITTEKKDKLDSGIAECKIEVHEVCFNEFGPIFNRCLNSVRTMLEVPESKIEKLAESSLNKPLVEEVGEEK